LATTKGGAVQAAQAERPIQLGPIVPFAALHLRHLGGQRPAPAVEIGLDRFPLRLQAETGLALLVGADPVVGDKTTDRHGLNLPVSLA
jgi:hypothetical protein